MQKQRNKKARDVLEIVNVSVALAHNPLQDVLKGIDLTIYGGQVHAIMGPNGAGKTTLSLSLMGHPNYKIKNQSFGKTQDKISKIKINSEDIINLTPEEKAKHGLFVSFQQPVEITGVSVLAFLRTAYKALHPEEKIPLSDFKKKVTDALKAIGLPEEFMKRCVNEGFSGGERKRAEIAQLLVLKPKFAILDEIDSGLDIDSLKTVAKVVKDMTKKQKIGILLITHYQRILHHLKPDYVHVLIDGKIKNSDGMALVRKIEKDGYAAV